MEIVTTQVTDLVAFGNIARALTMASPEVASRKPLAELVEATLLAAAGRSRHTRRSYELGIAFFLQFLEQERSAYIPAAWQPLAEALPVGRRSDWYFSQCPAAVLWLVDASTLDSYAMHRQNAGDGQNTVASRLAAVRTLLAVALRDNVLSHEQAEAMGVRPYVTRRQRDDEPTGRRLTPVEVRALRSTLGKEKAKDLRDQAILDIMLFAGLRRSEVAELHFRSFVQDRGRWWIRLRGKGKKTRRVKIHDVLYQTLSLWFSHSGLHWQGNADVPVFQSFRKGDRPTGRPITDNVVYEIVRSVGSRTKVHNESGVLVRLSAPGGNNQLEPHDLRRTFARNAYDNGATITQVQVILGHSDVKTTIRYIGLDTPDDDTAVDHVRY